MQSVSVGAFYDHKAGVIYNFRGIDKRFRELPKSPKNQFFFFRLVSQFFGIGNFYYSRAQYSPQASLNKTFIPPISKLSL